MNVDELEPGWHLDGFLYVPGEPDALDELLECVSSWSFLVPHARRSVVARNAYGALVLREGDGELYLLDPRRVAYSRDLAGFDDHAEYDTWRATHPAPGIRDVLVPVGGELVVTDIVSYYASTGATRERAYLASTERFPGWPEFTEPEALDDGRTWTARFDSWNERLDDLYYLVTAGDVTFMVQLYIWVDFRLPVFRELIRRDLRIHATAGITNTTHHR